MYYKQFWQKIVGQICSSICILLCKVYLVCILQLLEIQTINDFCHFFSFSLNFLNSKCNWSKWEKMVLISVAVCGTKIYYWYSKVNIKFFSLSCKYLYRSRSQYDNMRCRKTFPNNVLINKIWFSLNALWFYFEFFVLWKLNWC